MRLLGLDPGLAATGWGVVEHDRGRLSHVAHGVVRSDPSLPLAARLAQLADGLEDVLRALRPEEAAVEETFVNRNPVSALRLGQARGVVLLVPARGGLPVAEYAPNLVKKSIVGAGHAAKEQVQAMVRVLLPGVLLSGADAADALAVAICHAHHRRAATCLAAGTRMAGLAGAFPDALAGGVPRELRRTLPRGLRRAPVGRR